MRSGSLRSGAGLFAALVTGAVAGPECRSETVSRDVVVVGGGAAGAHAAVWLRDHDHSVIVVEKADQLGGHTDVYEDPATGPINIGVQAWMEYDDAFSFPERMNVSTSGSMAFAPNANAFVDFATGLPVDGYEAPSQDDMFAALQRYLDAITPYEDMVLPGFTNFPEPGSIPDDLLMPFRNFVEKYDLDAAVPQIWDSTGMGIGDTMDVSTLWVVQASGVPMVKALLGIGAAAVPASGRLYDLFDAVADFLGDDVLYSTTVASSERTDDEGVIVTAKNHETGKTTRIEAKRLLLAIEPIPENMAPFDPDATESAVFDKIGFSTVYAGVLHHPSLQDATLYSNRLPGTGPGNFTEFPLAAQVGSMGHLAGTEGLFQFTAVGTDEDTPESMKVVIRDAIDAMIEAGTIPESNGGLEFKAFADHGLMHPRVSADELNAGFVSDQVALQGHRSTWYTGAAFSAGFSTVLWKYNDELLPEVVEGL